LFVSNQERKELVCEKIYAPDQLGVESESDTHSVSSVKWLSLTPEPTP